MQTADWDLIIQPEYSWRQNFDLKKIWRYRDLLILLVKRDLVAVYKQTILGPLWFFIQPLLTTVMFTIVFGNIAKISTGTVPHTVFYMGGLLLWSYFADVVSKTSEAFITNQNLFSKVYFPRIIVPMSMVISNLIKLGIQSLMFLGFYLYFYFKQGLEPNVTLLLFPVYVLMTALLALSFGMIISSLTVKYRDLRFLIGFGIELLKFAAPIIYTLSEVGEGKFRWLILSNPMSSIIESFKYGCFSEGIFEWKYLAYSFAFLIVIMFFAIRSFSKVEKKFIDTV
ncbi:MAG: ABC transporter permease [Flavobacteriales bacterium]